MPVYVETLQKIKSTYYKFLVIFPESSFSLDLMTKPHHDKFVLIKQFAYSFQLLFLLCVFYFLSHLTPVFFPILY